MKKGIYILLTVVLSAVFVFLLHQKSKRLQYQNNTFVRLFPPHFLTNAKTINHNIAQPKILGITSDDVFISSLSNPTRFKAINYHTGKMIDKEVTIADNDKIAWRALTLHINPPNLYLSEGITPSILSGDIKSMSPIRKNIDSIYFSICLPISSNEYLFKSIDPKLEQNVLIKYRLDTLGNTQKHYILEKQIDGIFCTDGGLLYNEMHNQIIYVYRYRNQFLCLDHKLNLIHQGKTIDTISKAKLKVKKIKTEAKTEYVLANRPLTVNKRSYTYGNRLFIQSNLISKKENKVSFQKKSVIDVYSIKDTGYQYSFYIPAYSGDKIIDFAVYGSILVALYDHQLIAFKMVYPD